MFLVLWLLNVSLVNIVHISDDVAMTCLRTATQGSFAATLAVSPTSHSIMTPGLPVGRVSKSFNLLFYGRQNHFYTSNYFRQGLESTLVEAHNSIANLVY